MDSDILSQDCVTVQASDYLTDSLALFLVLVIHVLAFFVVFEDEELGIQLELEHIIIIWELAHVLDQRTGILIDLADDLEHGIVLQRDHQVEDEGALLEAVVMAVDELGAACVLALAALHHALIL